MLAAVTGPEEALVALAGGADILHLVDALFGALPLEQIAATVTAVAGNRPLWVAAGLPTSPIGTEYIKAVAALGVEGTTFPSQVNGGSEESVIALARSASPARLIGVLYADREPDLPASVRRLAATGFQGAMLDVADPSRRLLASTDIAALGAAIAEARECGLMFGLAGALEAPDVPRLLALRPDFLGFRAALCPPHDSGGGIDLAAVQAVRALIPDGRARLALSVPDEPLPAALAGPASTGTVGTDRVFVRDFVLPVRIGAYRHEHAAPQRVRFDVSVEVVRARGASQGMGEVFSYDLITDGIRALVAEGHVNLSRRLPTGLPRWLCAMTV
jgi:dihydroneopterin aldolase